MIQRETAASGSATDTGPVRTCIGCRRRELADELLRVVAVSTGNATGVLTVDPDRRLPGRGAWLHPRPQCLHEALRRRAFGRALRITGSPDTAAVIEYFEKSERPPSRSREQVAKNMSTP